MGYKELLSEMVEKSHMTLREIADKAKKKGVPIDPSYISKLQTGKQPPPSEDISKVLAEVCNSDPDSLVWEGYMEKAPEIIRSYVEKTMDYLRDTFIMVMETQIEDEDLIESTKHQFNKMSSIEFAKTIISYSEELYVVEDDFAYVEDEEGNKQKVLFAKSFEMPDDSMSPIISKGARVTFKSQSNVKNGDIVIVHTSENEYLVRRVVINKNSAILMPENSKYETKILPINSITIGGRINSVIVLL